MSFKPEVIADNSDTWASNALRFETETEANAYVQDLFMRWTSVNETRVVLSDDPVNALWKDGATVHLSEEEVRRKATATKRGKETERKRRPADSPTAHLYESGETSTLCGIALIPKPRKARRGPGSYWNDVHALHVSKARKTDCASCRTEYRTRLKARRVAAVESVPTV